jgi:pimeloyl-ACP methyl ester carboxylesterase
MGYDMTRGLRRVTIANGGGQMVKKVAFAFLIVLALPLISAWAETEFLPSIQDTIVVKGWLYVGPFSVGGREGIVGIIDDVSKFVPYEGLEHPSILAQGGKVKWKKTQMDSLGWVNLVYEDVLWDSLMDVWGVAAIVDAGYAYAEFQNEGERRALVMAKKTGSFYLNGKGYTGNPYEDAYMLTPVVLKDGLNKALVPTSGYADNRFSFSIYPSPDPLVIVKQDATLPDIIEGEPLRTCAGITLMNTTPSGIDDVTVKLGGGEMFREYTFTISRIEPLNYKKVPVELELVETVAGTDTAWIPVRVFSASLSISDSLPLRVRKSGESYIKTFISGVDSSCQYCGVLPPKGYDPQKKYALILSLHGAGVEAYGLTDSYKPKDWAFVVTPTNRRRFGFDWQDWGRLDALEVLELAKKAFPIDTNRVYLVGHSMGGHGTWHVGLTHFDLFAAICPAAGWACHQLYVPWFLQRSYVLAEPAQVGIRDMSLREDFTLNFVENALNLPVFILHGGLDDNVPTAQGRMFAGALDQLKYEYVYKEVPGQKHWWGIDSLNTACVDDPDMMAFIRTKERNPFPKHVIFKTSDIGQNNRSYWIRIDEQEKPFFESRVEAKVSGSSITLNTVNIRQMTLSLDESLVPEGSLSIVINGRGLTCIYGDQPLLSFYKKGDRFVPGAVKHAGAFKQHGFYGPMKQAYFSPFVVVYGTKADSATTGFLYRQAAAEAFRWWQRANGCVDVVADTEVTQEMIQRRNLIIFGGPGENSFTSRINSMLPIRSGTESVFVGPKEVRGKGLGVEFIYPNPLNPDKFVFVHEGNDSTGLAISNSFSTVYSGAGLPDFMVFGEEVKQKSWGGVICAGFFNTDWKVDGNLLYIRE